MKHYVATAVDDWERATTEQRATDIANAYHEFLTIWRSLKVRDDGTRLDPPRCVACHCELSLSMKVWRMREGWICNNCQSETPRPHAVPIRQ